MGLHTLLSFIAFALLMVASRDADKGRNGRAVLAFGICMYAIIGAWVSAAHA